MAGTDAWAAVLAERLVAASIQGGAAIAIVWIACRRPLRLAPRLQAALWWLASLKLIVALVSVAAVSVPLLPPVARAIDVEPRPEVHAPVVSAGPPLPEPIGEAAMPPPLEAASPGDDLPRTNPWIVSLAGLWLAGVAAGVVRLLVSFRRVRALVRRSEPAESDETALVADIASSLGLRRVPQLRVSREIETPQVVGVWRPTVLLPAAVSDWSADERRMAMAHELVHVQRRDVIAGWIPAVAERLFFFHPLAHLAAREYLVAREAACDAAVLRSLEVEPVAYGRLLVRLGVTRAEPAFGVTGSSSSASALRRRLEMLNDVTRTGSWMRRWIPVTAAVLTLVPLQLVARAEPVPDAPTTASIGESAARAQDLEPVPAVPQTDEAERLRQAERQAAERQAREQAAAARQEAERAKEQAATAQREAQLAAERAREQAAVAQREARLAAERAVAAQREAMGLRSAESARLGALIESLRALETADLNSPRDISIERLLTERDLQARLRDLTGRTEVYAASLDSAAGSLDEQMRRMSAQIEAVARAHETLVRQQQTLVDMQQRLAEQLEQLRTSLERLEETPR